MSTVTRCQKENVNSTIVIGITTRKYVVFYVNIATLGPHLKIMVCQRRF